MSSINEENKDKLLRMVEWAKYKIRLNLREETIYFKERQIWWASVGINIGCEIDGKHNQFERPVLIYKKISPSAFWAIPLTSKNKDYCYYIKTKDNLNNERILIISQIKLLSVNRLQRKIGKIEAYEYAKIGESINNLVLKKRNPLIKKTNGNLGTPNKQGSNV